MHSAILCDGVTVAVDYTRIPSLQVQDRVACHMRFKARDFPDERDMVTGRPFRITFENTEQAKNCVEELDHCFTGQPCTKRRNGHPVCS